MKYVLQVYIIIWLLTDRRISRTAVSSQKTLGLKFCYTYIYLQFKISTYWIHWTDTDDQFTYFFQRERHKKSLIQNGWTDKIGEHELIYWKYINYIRWKKGNKWIWMKNKYSTNIYLLTIFNRNEFKICFTLVSSDVK